MCELSGSKSIKWVHVAVGVIIKGDHVLLAKRAAHQHQGGLWEFPGGKVESGEGVEQALVRELKEELDINAVNMQPLIQIQHDYGDKQVLLDVWRVTHFEGEPKGQEGQPLEWVPLKELKTYTFPAANAPIVDALILPRLIAITPSEGDKEAVFQFCINAIVKKADGLQLRSPQLSFDDVVWLFNTLRQRGPWPIWVNSTHVVDSNNCWIPERSALFEGIHICARHLKLVAGLGRRPSDFKNGYTASCHNIDELKLAEQFSCAAYLSPVLATSSHLEQAALGWQAFTSLTAKATIPVYALGGLSADDLSQATANYAQGVAAISYFE